MLYLSLILIATGLFFIFYTLLIKAKKETGQSHPDKRSGYNAHVADKKLRSRDAERVSVASGNEQGKSFSGINRHQHQHAASSAVFVQGDAIESKRKSADNEVSHIEEEESVFEELSGDTPVVMFEDSSNIIDYNNNDSIIDSSLKEYRKIRRVGEGNLEISEGGVNFRAGKKLFRFEFRRIAEIKSGSNYFVLMMSGNDALKLFLFNKNSFLGERLKQVYNKYSKNVL